MRENLLGWKYFLLKKMNKMLSQKNRLKQFAKNLVVSLAISAARHFLNQQLEEVDAETLYETIRKNKRLWENLPKNVKRGGLKIAKRFRGPFKQFYEEINTDLILFWLKEDRPELYSIIINTQGGIEWLAEQIEEIKAALLKGI